MRFLLCLTCLFVAVQSLRLGSSLLSLGKRLGTSVKNVAAVVVIGASLGSNVPNAVAETTSAESVAVYFGSGCFWHQQHEFIVTERKVLGRGNSEITSLAGYAGGLSVAKDKDHPENKDGIVCYHNFQGKGDYGKLGYGEVVGMQIPAAKIGNFADEYFSLLDSNGDRPDKGDLGTEYRSLLGIPGGVKSPLFPAIQEAATKSGKGIKLVEGKGNDPDTLFKGTIFVMDTARFPFRQAEIYHQYHDGFMPGEQYGRSYHSLIDQALKDGRVKGTGCPE